MTAPVAAASRMKAVPAQTRLSLLASPMRRPALRAACVGARPATPEIAATIVSASRSTASVTAEGPAPEAMPVPARASRRGFCLEASDRATNSAPSRRAISARPRTSLPATRADTLKPSGCCASTSAVDLPMEPVAPRIVIRCVKLLSSARQA